MKTLQYIQTNYLAIDFFLSMSCNKNCHYCTSYTLEMRNLTVDMDFLRKVLGYLKQYKIRVNLLGGEPLFNRNYDESFFDLLDSSYDFEHALFSMSTNNSITPKGRWYKFLQKANNLIINIKILFFL